MSKINIIIKREYLRRVTKKSFLLITLLTPFCIAALLIVPIWLASFKSDNVKSVAVIDSTGKYTSLFEDTEHYHFIHSEKSLSDYRDNPDKSIFAILTITDDLLTNPKAGVIYSEKQIPVDLSRLVNYILREKIEEDKLATYDIPNLKEITEDSKINYSIQTIKWGADGTENVSSSEIAGVIGMIFTTLIYFFVFLYGNMVMQGVMEEKTNRIIEVIISSVRPFELMMGKIIGVLFVGLTQVFLWIILLFGIIMIAQGMLLNTISTETLQDGMVLMENNMVNEMMPGAELFQWMYTINWFELISCFILFFIGGFLLYSSIFAAIGSAIDQQEDSQQFMIPITILLLFAFYAGIYSAQNPDGPLAFWCSLVPITSPIVMMVRLPFDVPVWQTILSLVLLYGTAIGLTWVSAKIYRVGILMYGKKPSIKEIIKWVNYK